MIESTKRIWAMLPMEGKIELTVIIFVFPLFVLWQMLSGRNWQDSATTYIFVLIAIYIAMLLASTERTKAAKTAEFYRKRIEQEQEIKNRLNNSPTDERKNTGTVSEAAKTAEFYRKRIEQKQEIKNRLNNSPTEPRKKSVLISDTHENQDDVPREQELLKADTEK